MQVKAHHSSWSHVHPEGSQQSMNRVGKAATSSLMLQCQHHTTSAATHTIATNTRKLVNFAVLLNLHVKVLPCTLEKYNSSHAPIRSVPQPLGAEGHGASKHLRFIFGLGCCTLPRGRGTSCPECNRRDPSTTFRTMTSFSATPSSAAQSQAPLTFHDIPTNKERRGVRAVQLLERVRRALLQTALFCVEFFTRRRAAGAQSLRRGG
jgi:hypothetical protein